MFQAVLPLTTSALRMSSCLTAQSAAVFAHLNLKWASGLQLVLYIATNLVLRVHIVSKALIIPHWDNESLFSWGGVGVGVVYFLIFIHAFPLTYFFSPNDGDQWKWKPESFKNMFPQQSMFRVCGVSLKGSFWIPSLFWYLYAVIEFPFCTVEVYDILSMGLKLFIFCRFLFYQCFLFKWQCLPNGFYLCASIFDLS